MAVAHEHPVVALHTTPIHPKGEQIVNFSFRGYIYNDQLLGEWVVVLN